MHRQGAWNIAIVAALNAPPNSLDATRATRAILKGELLAWDPVKQKEAWRVQYDGPWNGGALATAGNLVFQGNARGEFQAFDAANGKPLWKLRRANRGCRGAGQLPVGRHAICGGDGWLWRRLSAVHRLP